MLRGFLLVLFSGENEEFGFGEEYELKMKRIKNGHVLCYIFLKEHSPKVNGVCNVPVGAGAA